MPVDLTIVIPTYNEVHNIAPLIRAIEASLPDINWEIIFVDDDSPDGTAKEIRKIAQQDTRIRCIHRVGRRGLSSACIEGMQASAADYIAVMDADMQHDEKILGELFRRLKDDELDIVVGSRFVDGGSTGTLASHRVWLSKLAYYASKIILKVPLNDPMSGYFMLRRSMLNSVIHELSGKGFKILLDIFVAAPSTIKFAEVPYQMRSRELGESKLDTMVIWEYAVLLIDKSIGKIIPFRFILFVLVGMTGILVHLLILGTLYKFFGLGFWESQMAATILAMTNNFVLNNIFTYHDRRLHGMAFLKGLLSFYLACSIGAVINVQLADFIFMHQVPWWISGMIGAFVGSVWNYAITSTFTWKTRTKPAE